MKERLRETLKRICFNYNKGLSTELKALAHYVLNGGKVRKLNFFGYDKNQNKEINIFYQELNKSIIQLMETTSEEVQMLSLIAAWDDLNDNPFEIESFFKECTNEAIKSIVNSYLNMKILEKIGSKRKMDWVKEEKERLSQMK